MVAGDAQNLAAQDLAAQNLAAQNLVAQMRRGVLPYCVLAMLRGKERYGFELVHSLGTTYGLVTGEGTIYPLLARLRRQGLVETSWRESESGPPRRYYRLSSEGKDALDEFSGSWRSLRTTVDALLDSDDGGRAGLAEDLPGMEADTDKERTR